MHLIKKLSITLIFSVLCCGCSQQDFQETSPINQNDLCEVDSLPLEDVAGKCKPGQKVVYLPKTFGNDQLPIIFAAIHCDLRYSVALTKGAVACIYTPVKQLNLKKP